MLLSRALRMMRVIALNSFGRKLIYSFAYVILRALRDRAAIRSHWFTLQSEKTIAEDCLQNLRIARQRCKKLRRSYPILAGSDFIEKDVDATSRTRPYEKSDKPRHTYHNMSLTNLDFKFSGMSSCEF